MKSFLQTAFFLALIIFSSSSIAQTTETLNPNWKQGDRKRIDETISLTMKSFGFAMPAAEMKTSHEIFVKQVTSEGYILEYKQLPTGSATLAGNTLPKEMIDSLGVLEGIDQIVMEVLIDKKGNVKDLLNWKAVEKGLKSYSTNLVTNLEKSNKVSKAKADSVRQAIKKQTFSKDSISKELLEGLTYLFSGYDVPYGVDKVKSYNANRYPKMNSFGMNEVNLPAELTAKLVEKTAAYTSTSYDIKYDMKSLIKVLADKDGLGNFIPKEELNNIFVTENRSFRFDSGSNWVSNITITSAFQMTSMLGYEMKCTYVITTL